MLNHHFMKYICVEVLDTLPTTIYINSCYVIEAITFVFYCISHGKHFMAVGGIILLITKFLLNQNGIIFRRSDTTAMKGLIFLLSTSPFFW